MSTLWPSTWLDLPRSRVTRVAAPAQEPVSTSDLKEHLRLDHDLEMARLDSYLRAASRHIEQSIKRSLMAQTWRLVFDRRFPTGEVELPYPPVQSITSVAYVDAAGASITLDSSAYRLTAGGEWGGVVAPAHGTNWPATRDTSEAATITYVAGHTSPYLVPEDLKHAVMLLAAHWFEHREGVMEGREFMPMPWGVEEIVRAYAMPVIA